MFSRYAIFLSDALNIITRELSLNVAINVHISVCLLHRALRHMLSEDST